MLWALAIIIIIKLKNWHAHLIGPVEEADAMADFQLLDVVGEAALGELVGLDAFQAHDRLRHDAAVPISAMAFVTCPEI